MPALRYREISAPDLPALFAIRVQTHENRLSAEELAAMGITPASVEEKLRGSLRGWLCEADDRPVGFAMGDCATGELWVIAILPEFIGQGIGGVLLGKVEDWLRQNGWTRAWLTTDVDPALKAYGFYRYYGWLDDRVEDGLRYMYKDLKAG